MSAARYVGLLFAGLGLGAVFGSFAALLVNALQTWGLT